MDMPRHLLQEDVSNEDVVQSPPMFLMHRPGGQAVAAVSFEEAQRGAENLAGKYPGAPVGVYRLIGFSFIQQTPAPFVSVDPALLEAPKDKGI